MTVPSSGSSATPLDLEAIEALAKRTIAADPEGGWYSADDLLLARGAEIPAYDRVFIANASPESVLVLTTEVKRLRSLLGDRSVLLGGVGGGWGNRRACGVPGTSRSTSGTKLFGSDSGLVLVVGFLSTRREEPSDV